jgi:hypothetical protein
MDRDVRESVVAFLVERGLGVLQLSRSHRDLEDVFLQLSGSAAVAASNSNQGNGQGEATP